MTILNVYKQWAPVLARITFGGMFLFAAFGKLPGSEMFIANVMAAVQVGVPFAYIAVLLAFVLEVVTGLMLVLGYHTRLAALALIPYIALLTVLFHISFSSPIEIGFFVDHLILIAGLIYVSVYGAQRFALRKDF